MLAIAALFYLYEFLLRVAPNVLFTEWVHDFNLDANQFGILSSSYYWSYAILQLPVGALTDKWGPRRLLTFAIFLCALSTGLFALTKDFYLACVLRLCIGAGSAFAFICCLKIIATWFKPHLFPMLTGLTLTIGTLGAVASVPVSYSLNYMSWQMLFYGLAAIGILMSGIAWLVVRDRAPLEVIKSTPTQHVSAMTCLAHVVKSPINWLIAIYAFLVTAPTDALGGTWGVAFLMHVHDISKDQAALAVSCTFLGLACGSSFMGWLASKWGECQKPMFLSSLCASLVLILLIFTPTLNTLLSALLFFLFGFWGVYVLSFIVARHLNDAHYVATAVGFVNMLSMFGSALLTYWIGAILNALGEFHAASNEGMILTASDYQWGLCLIPFFYIISAVLVVPWIKDKKRSYNHDVT